MVFRAIRERARFRTTRSLDQGWIAERWDPERRRVPFVVNSHGSARFSSSPHCRARCDRRAAPRRRRVRASSAVSVAGELEGSLACYRHRARSGRIDCQGDPVRGGAWDEDLVKRADLDSAVSGRAVTLRIHGVAIVAVVAALRFLPVPRPDCGLRSCRPARRPARALRPSHPLADVFTRGLRAIAAFRRFRRRTGR